MQNLFNRLDTVYQDYVKPRIPMEMPVSSMVNNVVNSLSNKPEAHKPAACVGTFHSKLLTEKDVLTEKDSEMEEFDEFCYSKKDLIGHGAFAVVYKGRYKTKNVDVAIKAIAKKNLTKAKQLLTKEIKILKELSGLKHENLVALLKCVESPTHVFLVMEFCNFGDLADYLHGKGTINEATIQHFFSQISRALEAMNLKTIVHRDLKPQNILLCNPTKQRLNPLATELVVKLADFGFARFLTDGGMAGTLCGSPMYMAPEVIMSQQYCAKADLWSIGTIMYQCLVGHAPFIARTPNELKQFYETHKELNPQIPDYCSPPLRDLLKRLLKRNAKDRIEFADFFNHPFLNSVPISSPSKRLLDQAINQQFGPYSPTPARRALPLGQPNVVNYTATAQKQLRMDTEMAKNPPPRTQHVPTSTYAYGASAAQRSVAQSGIPSPLPSSRHISPNTRPDQPTGNNAMTDSSDFTFLPPLEKQKSPRYTSGTSLNAENPVKQVQVHASNASNVRAVPVPSQRLAYAKMEERRNASRSPVGPLINMDNEPRLADQGTRIPSVEDISLPETHFVVREPPKVEFLPRTRRYTVTDLSTCAEDENTESPPDGTVARTQAAIVEGNPPFPKSATSAVPLSSVQDENQLPSSSRELNVEYTARETLQANPPVDNIRFLSTSPNFANTEATVKIISSGRKTMTTPKLVQDYHSSMSDYEEEAESPIRLPFAGNQEEPRSMEESSSSQMMESVSQDDTTGTTTSSGVYSAAKAAAANRPPEQNRPRSREVSGEVRNEVKSPVFDVEPPPELEQETIMEAEHRQILAKLKFVAELIDALIGVAENMNNPIAMMMEGGRKQRNQSASSDAYRRAEQLVVYVRALHVLSSALVMAQRHVSQETLHPSPAVQHVLNQLNDKYHYCLVRSQELASLGIPGADPSMAIVSAERIMYRHAMDLCQSAALDELFGNPHLCPKRYQTAYMMLHTLSEQVQNEQDKSILSKYKNAVEKRLRILERQGYVTAVPSN